MTNIYEKISQGIYHFSHPYLWSLPFVALIIINIVQILFTGPFAKNPWIYYKPQNSINVILFSSLWLWSRYRFSKMGYPRLLTLYLAFAVLFACNGLGEYTKHILWFFRYTLEYNWFTWIWVGIYPLFFLFHNIALLTFIDIDKKHIKKIASSLLITIGFYLVYKQTMGWIDTKWVFPSLPPDWKIGTLIPNTGVDQIPEFWEDYRLAQVPYYFARLSSVLSYALLLGLAHGRESIISGLRLDKIFGRTTISNNLRETYQK